MNAPFYSSHLSAKWWQHTVVACIVIIIILLVDRWAIINLYPAPSGADPGNWLTFAYDLSGEYKRLAEWAYPPLLLWCLRALLALFPALLALKIVGVLSWIAMTVGFLIILRRFTPKCPIYIQVAIGVLFMLAGYQGEVFAWGGYPQLMGMSFLIVAIPSTEQWLQHGNRRWLLLATITSIGVIYSHHLLTAILPLFFALLYVWLYLLKRIDLRRLTARSVTLGLLLVILSVPVIPTYWRIWQGLFGNPVNASGFGRNSAALMMQYVFQDALWLWLLLVIIALFVPIWQRNHAISGTMFVFSSGTLGLLLLMWEVRLVQLWYVGIGLSLGILLEAMWQAAEDRPSMQFASLIALSVMLFLVLPSSQLWFRNAIQSGYRIVDQPFLEGLDWLADNGQSAERVLVSPAQYPEGWWIEGYTLQPTLYATDLRWLFFETERVYTRIANETFDNSRSADDALKLMQQNNIRWVFIDKNFYDASHFESLIDGGMLVPSFDNARILLLRVKTR